MGDRHSSWWGAAAYVATGVLGWGSVAMMRGHVDGLPSTEMMARRASRGAPRPASTAEQLLSRLIEEQDTERKAQASGRAIYYDKLKSRTEALRKTLKPANPPEAAFREAMAAVPQLLTDAEALENQEALALATARLLQWQAADPEAAFNFLHERDGKNDLPPVKLVAVAIWSGETPLEGVFDQIRKKNPVFNQAAYRGLAENRCAKGDIAAWEETLAQLPSGTAPGIYNSHAVSIWPEDKLPDLLDHVSKGKHPDAQLVGAILARMPDSDAYTRIRDMVTDGRAKSSLGGSQEIFKRLYANTAVPVEERIDLIKQLRIASGQEPEQAEKATRQTVLDLEMKTALTNPDAEPVMRAFREGTMGSSEALQALMAAMPASSLLDADAVKARLMQQLLQANPTGALDLLSGVPPIDRYKQVLKLSQQGVNDPRALLSLYLAVPADPAMGGSLQDRFMVWSRIGNNALDRYGDDYVNWVKTMPEGRDRDMALSVIAVRIENKNPEEAARLRALKTVPAK